MHKTQSLAMWTQTRNFHKHSQQQGLYRLRPHHTQSVLLVYCVDTSFWCNDRKM